MAMEKSWLFFAKILKYPRMVKGVRTKPALCIHRF